MDASVHEGGPDVGEQPLGLLVGHAGLAEGLGAHGGQQLDEALAQVHADEAQALVARPGAQGHVEDALVDVDVAHGLHLGLEPLGHEHVEAVAVPDALEDLVELVQRVVVRHGAVVAHHARVDLLPLEPAAWLEISVSKVRGLVISLSSLLSLGRAGGALVPEHCASYAEGIFQHGRCEANVGVVYIPPISPFFPFYVVDDEPTIRGDKLRLYGGQIETNHLCTGV